MTSVTVPLSYLLSSSVHAGGGLNSTRMGITPKKPTQESTAPIEILFALLVRSSQRK